MKEKKWERREVNWPADSLSIPSGMLDTLASLEWQYTNEEGTSMRLGDADLPPKDVIFWDGEADAGLVEYAVSEGDRGAEAGAEAAAAAAAAAAAFAAFISRTFISM